MASQLNVRLVLKSMAVLLAVGLVAIGVGRLVSRGSSSRILAKANALAAQEQFGEAVPLFRTYLDNHPDDESALMGYARALEKAGRSAGPAALVETYRKVLELNPRNYEALRRSTELSLAAARLRIRFSPDAPNEWAEAAKLARRMVEIAPDEAEGHRYLGLALVGVGQIDEAKAVFEKLIALHPTDEDAYFILAEAIARRGAPAPEWRKYIDQAVASNASSSSVHLKAYHFFAGQGDAESAKKSLARALEVGPKAPEVLFAAAIADEREGQVAPAREKFLKIQEADPADPAPYVALARLARRNGETDKALGILRDGIDRAKGRKAELLFWIGDMLLEQGRSQEADQAIDQLRSITPGAPLLALLEGQQSLSVHDDHAARSQLERAARGLELVIRAFPPLAQAHLVVGRRYAALVESWFLLGKCYLLLGTCYGRLGEVGAARETLAAALKVWPTSAATRSASARALLAANEPDAAREQAELATKLAEEQKLEAPGSWLALAQALRAQSRGGKDSQALLHKAIEAATRAVNMRPMSDSIVFLAQLHLDAGEPSLAQRVLERDLADPKEKFQLQIARIALFASAKPPDLDRARREYATAVQKHGETIELRLLQPLLLGPDASFEAREKCLLEMLAKASGPDVPRIRAALGTLYLGYMKPQRAMEQLKAIAQAESHNIAVRKSALELAFEAGLQDDIPALLGELSKLEGRDAPDVICLEAEYELITMKPETAYKKSTEIAERLESLLRRSPTWRAWALLGDIRKLQGKLSEAVDCYQAAFRANPSSVRAGLPFIRSLNEAERYEEAAVILDRLAKLDAQSPVLLELQFDKFRRRSDLAGAIGLMENRLARQPQNIAVVTTLADLHLAKRNFDEAERLLRKAHEAAPGDSRVVDRLVLLLNRTKRADESLKLCNEMIAAEPKRPSAYVSRSRHCRLSGQPAKALDDLKQALDLTPAKDAASRKFLLTNLGVVCAEQGDTKAALNWHRRAAALEPPGSDARKLLVERLLRASTRAHMDEAGKIANGLLAEAPDDPQAHLLKARIAALDPETLDVAKQHCGKAIELAPRMGQAHSLLSTICETEGDLRRAAEAASRAVSGEPNSFPVLLQYARLLRLNKQSAEARTILDRAIRLDSGDLRGTFAAAELARAETGTEAAVTILEKALAASDASGAQRKASLCLNLAWYLQKANRAAEAEVRLREACTLSGNAPDTVQALARLLEQQKRYEDTDRLLDQIMKGVDVTKAFPFALLRAETLLARNRGREDLDEAERCARQALTAQPDSSQATRILADIAAARNDVPGAEALYRKALALNGRNPLAANNLAWLFCQAGKHQEALRFARRAVVLEASNPEFHDTLGETCYQLRDFAEAERAFSRCVDLNPNNARTLFRLGLTLAKLGKNQPAKDTLTRALQMTGAGTSLLEDQRNEAQRTLAQLSQVQKP